MLSDEVSLASHDLFPLDDAHGTDVIIRSNDCTDFQVHKLVIGLASPIFKNMFGIPLPPSDSPSESPDTFHNGLPVVKVTEERDTLGYILSFCYFGLLRDGIKEWTEIEQAIPVLEAARKYEMDALIHYTTDKLLHIAEAIPELSLRVFAVACRFNLDEVAEQAAKLTVRHEMKPVWRDTMPVELRHVSVGAYVGLASYHEACIAEAMKVATELQWTLTEIPGRTLTVETHKSNRKIEYRNLSASNSYIWLNCSSSICEVRSEDRITAHMADITSDFSPRRWWKVYMDHVTESLSHIPSSSVVGKPDTMGPALAQAAMCSTCGPKAYQDMMEFNGFLKSRIDFAVSQVCP